MHMKGASGSRQTAMNDPGAQQPSQMFLTWVKARPQHRELRALPTEWNTKPGKLIPWDFPLVKVPPSLEGKNPEAESQ